MVLDSGAQGCVDQRLITFAFLFGAGAKGGQNVIVDKNGNAGFTRWFDRRAALCVREIVFSPHKSSVRSAWPPALKSPVNLSPHHRNPPVLGTEHHAAGRALADRRLAGATVEDDQPAVIESESGQIAVQLLQTFHQRVRLAVAPSDAED